MWDRLLVDCNIATMDPAVEAPFGAIENGAIGIQDGRIVRVGRRDRARRLPGEEGRAARGRLGDAGPGRLPHPSRLRRQPRRASSSSGSKARPTKRSRAPAAASLSTVKATRAASLDELVEASRPRLGADGGRRHHRRDQVGLRARHRERAEDAARGQGARRERDGAGRHHPCSALHALPPEYASGATIMSAGDRVDAAGGAARGPGRRGRRLLRRDRLHPRRGRAPCSRRRASHGLGSSSMPSSSAIWTAPRWPRGTARFRPTISSMSTRPASRRWRAAGMVAVLLPGAFYALRETRKPPVELLRRHGVPMAVATDCNPGTSPVLSPTLMLNMACTLFGLTPEEALAGMTRKRRAALGLQDEIGTISAGKAADLCVWRIGRPAELCYWIGLPGPERRIVAGEDAVIVASRLDPRPTLLEDQRHCIRRRDNSRHIAAPTGTEISCKSWTTEAAMRMLMNNLDPGRRRGARGAGRLWRHRPGGARLGKLRRDRRDAEAARGRRDPARPVGQAGRRVPHP